MSGSRPDGLSDLPSWAVVSDRRVEHIAGVVAVLETWAGAMGVAGEEADRWRRAALYHDALRDADADVLRRYGPMPAGWPRPVWHGPAAANAAALHGERDASVLDAVRYHSLGRAGWDAVGRMLFLADALEPGRSHDRAALDALAARVPVETDAVLREVAERKVRWLERRGRSVARETWDFRNSLGADAPSSSA